MKSLLYCVLFAIISSAFVSAETYPYKSTFYGCPVECHTQEAPACGMDEDDLPYNFVAMHKEYVDGSDDYKREKYCGSYYVGMIIDTEKASGPKKMVRAKVVDSCGTCAVEQVDLNYYTFIMLSHRDTGVIKMMYMLLTSDNKVVKKPTYSDSYLAEFAKKQGKSKNEIIDAFVKSAKILNSKKMNCMSNYPWKGGKYQMYKDGKVLSSYDPSIVTTTTIKVTTTKTVSGTGIPVLLNQTITTNTNFTAPVKNNNTVPLPADKNNNNHQPLVEAKPEGNEDTNTEDDHGTPVTAGIIGGSACILGAAGVGLLVLKRKSPQRYDDLKQRFPEAFTTVKRSISRSATNIKRGVSRTVSRRGTRKTTNRLEAEQPPLPTASNYTFTVQGDDGLPRITLYDDPCPVNPSGNEHW